MLFSQIATGADEARPDTRLENATTALHEIMRSPDRGIPHDLLEKAQCVVVVPDLLKAAFVVGGQYGRGYATCRHGGDWSGPAAVRMEGGSFGFQLGGSATDLIMLIMNQHGMSRLLGDKFTIGGEAAAAAGPIGRETSAQTDIAMHAEILTWSRSRGVFAGISLNGATLRPDHSEDRRLYGEKMSNREILEGEVAAAPAGQRFIAEVRRSAGAWRGPVEADARRRPAQPEEPRPMLTEQPIQFAKGETTVPKAAEPMLAQIAQTLKDNPGWKIRVEGYTDNSGNRFENEEVSKKRADSVRDWLANRGVDRSRMSVAAHGENHPLGDNSSEEGRAQNRRVEIVRTDVVMKTGL